MTFCLAVQAQQRADEQAFTEQPSSPLNSHQAEPDSAFLQPGPLWESYRHCAARARKKNAARRGRSFALLKMPDGRQVEFGPQARAGIDPTLIARIRYFAIHCLSCCLHPDLHFCSCPAPPCPALPCPALPCPALPCPALSFPVLAWPVLSYPAGMYPITLALPCTALPA